MRQQYIINKEFGRLDLLDSRFYMTVKGDKFPSVTTILECYPKGPQFYQWLKDQGANADEILDEAGRLGSIVHGMAEDYDRGDVVSLLNDAGEPKCKLKDWAMFERYIDFSTRFKPEILHNELHLCSDQLKYGGTLDRIIKMNDKNILIDIKTSNYLHNSFWCQLAAYNELFNEFYPDEKIHDTAILWLNAKTRTNGKGDSIQGTGWQLVYSPKSVNYYWKIFQSVQRTWLEEYGDTIPKEISYGLSYKKLIEEKTNGKPKAETLKTL